jgi:ribosome-associated protein
MARIVNASLLQSEIYFTASRSDGPGGQNVNKVNSKITLRFDIRDSQILTESEKALIVDKLRTRITNDGVLLLTSQESRSQLANKDMVVKRFDEWMRSAFMPVKKRKKTKPTRSATESRIKSKKIQSEKKKWRGRDF